MGDLTETIVFRSNPVTGIKFQVAVAMMTTKNDTITFGELTDILAAQAFRMDTGASTTATDSTNVLTLTGDLKNTPILAVVTGV